MTDKPILREKRKRGRKHSFPDGVKLAVMISQPTATMLDTYLAGLGDTCRKNEIVDTLINRALRDLK